MDSSTSDGETNEGESSESPPVEPPTSPVETNRDGEEGLPEWEPLTPELVEDEAIRGDFVIRWAIVGVALLFGLSQIADSRTLVHIKTGQYLASHGFVPPSKDVFTYTANDRPWWNVSWLFDLIAAGTFNVAGGIGLTVIQGILAGVAFGCLAHAQRSNIRTWWGSVCAGLALLVAYPQVTIQPEIVTLVGLSITLFWMARVEETSSPKLLWSLVPLIWIWAQLDSHVFLGWLVILTMAIGESLRSNVESNPSQRVGSQTWWVVAVASFIAMGIHPFSWNAWLSPLRLYTVDYPALRQLFPRPNASELLFYPITDPVIWSSVGHGIVAAIVLFVATAVVMTLNRERLHPGHIFLFLVFNALGCVTTHELAAASFVNCAICAVNAQVWYRNRFGQVYSTDWRELIFSRGGRAVTVLSLFLLAWLVISGRIEGPDGKRTGIGFDKTLAVQMESFQNLSVDAIDDHPFNTSIRQGDLLIWAGMKPFIDSRAGLFYGTGDGDLISQYNQTRRAVQRKREGLPGSGERTVWRAAFEKHDVSQVIPRLTGPFPPPDYTTFGDLLSSSDWVLTRLTPAAAVFCRNSVQDAKGKEYIAKNRLQFADQAFRMKSDNVETIRDPAKPAKLYDNIFSLRQNAIPA
ncbi:MAG: hypothetical protein FJ267_01435, partial [Planctomycetes bacterium]|nr:hypothetical protein [Planctomycetota bacterium]